MTEPAHTRLDEFAAGFDDEPGYLDFARFGPPGLAVRSEESVQSGILGRARYGTMQLIAEPATRMQSAIAALLRLPPDHIVFQPNTSQGLMHAMFGLTGEVALSPAEFPSITFAVARAEEALRSVTPLWLEPDHGRVTPGTLLEQLTPETVAVAVSLVDFRTGYLADLEGIRQVIGDRLLIVDAIQGFGVVDAPFEVADVVTSGGQKWVRAGAGTGFLALSDRAIERLLPVFSGFVGTDAENMPMDEILPPTHAAAAFALSVPDPVAQFRFAAALEGITAVGVPTLNSALADAVDEVIELVDEFGIEVVSPRPRAERAGIVVIRPQAHLLTALSAALHNHGVSATVRQGDVRLSPHVTTGPETLAMLRASLSAAH